MARALELEGITTVLTSWNARVVQKLQPPRASLTKLGRGVTLGHPGDEAQQRRVIERTLDLLEHPVTEEYLELAEK